MPKLKLSNIKINQIIKLRKSGHSYPEIKNIVGCGLATAIRYSKDIKLSKKTQQIINFKQGGSKERSEKDWKQSIIEAKKLMGKLSNKEMLCLLIGIYWGEGSKGDLNIMNGDPKLLYVFIKTIKKIGVKDDEFIYSLRIFNSSSKEKCLKYWSKNLNISKKIIKIGEVVKGSDSNRLPNGMCRVRVKKPGKYFKLLISMIRYVPEVV